MTDFLLNWGILCSVFMIALMSPGPDFVMAVKHAVCYDRRAGIVTAAGFAGGVSVHVTYCLLGLATVIAQSILLFNIFKFIGAGYLIYIGVQSLCSKGFGGDTDVTKTAAVSMSDMKAFRAGFITNLFNPKATLFFMALFTQIIHPDFPAAIGFLYGATCVVMTFLWFTVVASVLTTPHIKARFLRASKWIDRVCGVALLALGIRLALTKVAAS